MKPFEELTTEEVVNLTEETIKQYISSGVDEKMIRDEVENCKSIMQRI